MVDEVTRTSCLAQPRGGLVPSIFGPAPGECSRVALGQAAVVLQLLQLLQRLHLVEELSPSPTPVWGTHSRSSPRVLSRCTLTSRGRPCASLSHYGVHREGTLRWRGWGSWDLMAARLGFAFLSLTQQRWFWLWLWRFFCPQPQYSGSTLLLLSQGPGGLGLSHGKGGGDILRVLPGAGLLLPVWFAGC